jgi:hypothetical protein
MSSRRAPVGDEQRALRCAVDVEEFEGLEVVGVVEEAPPVSGDHGRDDEVELVDELGV